MYRYAQTNTFVLSHESKNEATLLILDELGKYPYTLDPVGELKLQMPNGSTICAQVFRTSNGFPVWWVKDVLRRNGMQVASEEHLEAYAGSTLSLPLPVIALGSPTVRPIFGEWYIEEYPAMKPDGSRSKVEVDYKEYNKNDFRWIDEEVGVLAIE